MKLKAFVDGIQVRADGVDGRSVDRAVASIAGAARARGLVPRAPDYAQLEVADADTGAVYRRRVSVQGPGRIVIEKEAFSSSA